MMLWLYIVGCILLLLFGLLMLSTVLQITATNEEFYVDVKYAFLKFRIYPQDEKNPKKIEKKKRKEERKKAKENAKKAVKTETVSEDETVTETKSQSTKTATKKGKKVKTKKEKKFDLQQVSDLLDMLQGIGKHLVNLIHNIRINLWLDLSIGGEDAAEAAINYGKYNAVVWTLIGQASGIMTVKPQKVNIKCDFEYDRLKFDLFAKIKLRLITVLVIGLCILFRILVNNIKKGKVK